MKRAIILLLPTLLLFCFFSPSVKAEEPELFDNSIEEIKNGVSDDTRQEMERLGIDDADVTQLSDLSLSKSMSLIGDLIARSASRPMASLVLLAAVILLASLLESYTFSLRYVDTKDVMNAVTSLMVVAALVTPIGGLIESAADAVRGAASLMLIYAPVMVGIMVFSGHVVRSGGYYATVMTACQGIAQLSSKVIAPLLHIFLALSVSSAISERVKLSGLCELIAKLTKWMLTFAMTLFTAILSIQGIAANAADSIASKAVRFTLNSLIPVVGASISEAYSAVNSSVNLLRSGLGVFVIVALILSFLPLIVQILLWQLSILAAKTVAETFGISSVGTVLNAVSVVLSVLTAVMISLASVFLISSGVMISVGGGA